MAVVDRKKLLEAYKEIDLFRAKYRDPEDFTPHAWCFHGEQAQGWSGVCNKNRLYIRDGTVKLTNINADTYKHLSFNVEMPNYWYERTLTTTTTPRPSCNGYVLNLDSICKEHMGVPFVQAPPIKPVNKYSGNNGCLCNATSYTSKLCYRDLTYCGSDVSICNIDINTCAENTATCLIDRPIEKQYEYRTIYDSTGRASQERYELCTQIDNLDMSKLIKSTYTKIVRPFKYSYELQLKYTKDYITFHTISIEVSTPEKLVYLNMEDYTEWTGNIKRIDFNIRIKDNGKYIDDYKYQPVLYLEYFKVDTINVFDDIKRNKTIVAKHVNTLRNEVELINTGFHNEPCNMGDVPGYSKITGDCGNSDIIITGRKPTKAENPKGYIDWNNPGTLDDRVKSFIDTIKSGDVTSATYKIPRLAPYNGCSTCDLHTCDCYAVHYGRIECITCNTCYGHTPCTCDTTCFTQARSCGCNQGCHSQAKACTCHSKCYGQSSCTCDRSGY